MVDNPFFRDKLLACVVLTLFEKTEELPWHTYRLPQCRFSIICFRFDHKRLRLQNYGCGIFHR